MFHVFLVNPVAGKGKGKEEIIESIHTYFKLKEQTNYIVYVTQRKGHATELVEEECAKRSFCKFYSVGGDGTLNEIVRGAYRHKNCEIGIYPCGTGNDFVKTLGEKYTSPSLEQLIEASGRECDLITVNGQVGINVASIGFDSEVANNVDRFKRRFSGSLAYTFSIFYCLITKVKNKMEITVDGQTYITGNFLLCVAANGKYYGGGYNPAPDACITDGELDFTLVNSVSRFKIAKLLGKYKKGEQGEFPFVTMLRGEKMLVSSDNELCINIDGEIFFAKKAEFGVMKKTIKIVDLE